GILAGVQHVAVDQGGLTAWEVTGYDRELATTEANRAAVVADYLKSRPAQPFFVDVGFEKTHRPFAGPADDARCTNPRSATPPDFLPDLPATRHDTAALNTSVRELDRDYGVVLKALDDSGLARNTLVICTTDHGLPFPLAKSNLTDAGIGVLLIVRGPGGFEGGKII